MNKIKIVCVVGSTRAKQTTSESIIDYLIGTLNIKNGTYEKIIAHKLIKNSAKFNTFMKSLYMSDVFIICSPMYLDCLPYPLTALLEKIKENAEKAKLYNKRVIAIIHSGYLKPVHREVALKICENFAQQLKMHWQGGIGFGGTSIIGGEDLKKIGFYTKFIRKSLDMISIAIKCNQDIPEKAISISHKSPIPLPRKILIPLINIKMRREAKNYGITNLYVRPYEEI